MCYSAENISKTQTVRQFKQLESLSAAQAPSETLTHLPREHHISMDAQLPHKLILSRIALLNKISHSYWLTKRGIWHGIAN